MAQSVSAAWCRPCTICQTPFLNPRRAANGAGGAICGYEAAPSRRAKARRLWPPGLRCAGITRGRCVRKRNAVDQRRDDAERDEGVVVNWQAPKVDPPDARAHSEIRKPIIPRSLPNVRLDQSFPYHRGDRLDGRDALSAAAIRLPLRG